LLKLSDNETADSNSDKDDPPKAKSKAEQASERRNLVRVDCANQQDQSLLGKYLPANLDVIIPEILKGPDDSFEAPHGYNKTPSQ
jgi:hypothetical protein